MKFQDFERESCALAREVFGAELTNAKATDGLLEESGLWVLTVEYRGKRFGIACEPPSELSPLSQDERKLQFRETLRDAMLRKKDKVDR